MMIATAATTAWTLPTGGVCCGLLRAELRMTAECPTTGVRTTYRAWHCPICGGQLLDAAPLATMYPTWSSP